MQQLNKSWKRTIIYSKLWCKLYKNNFWTSQQLIEHNPQFTDSSWYYYFQSRLMANKEFNVFSIYIGYDTTYYWLSDQKIRLNPKQTLNSLDRNHMHLQTTPIIDINGGESGYIPSIICKCKGHHWGAGSGANQFMIGNQIISNHYWAGDYDKSNIRYPWFYSNSINMEVIQILISWLFKNGFSKSMNSEKHPILFIIPYYLLNIDRERISSLLLQYYKEFKPKWNQPNLINSPYIYLKERELIATDICKLDTAIVIFLDSKISTIASVKYNKIMEPFCYKLFENKYIEIPEICKIINDLIQLQLLSRIICYKNIIVVSDKEIDYTHNLILELKKILIQDIPLEIISNIQLINPRELLYWSIDKSIFNLKKMFIKNPF